MFMQLYLHQEELKTVCSPKQLKALGGLQDTQMHPVLCTRLCIFELLYSSVNVLFESLSLTFVRWFSGQNVVSVIWEMWQSMIFPLKTVPLCSSQTDPALQKNSHVPTSTVSQRIICVIL